MQIFEKNLTDVSISYPLESVAALTDILFLDIETTGLRKESDSVFLIGAVYFDADQHTWKSKQWFAENPEEEKNILDCFLGFAYPYKVLIHFNGNRFDLPFLKRRTEQYDLSDPLDDMRSVDLYQIVHPWRNLLGLIDGRQQTLEKFIGTGRIEDRSGREIASIWREYRSTRSSGILDMILTHNEQDVCGLLRLSDVLAYRDIDPESLAIHKAQANFYTDYDENTREEVLLYFHMDHRIPRPLLGTRDGCLFSAEDDRGVIKVPVFSGELHYYYADYKEYWYFPEEDVAMHRSVGSFADRTHRVPATPATCYTRKTSSFLPEWSEFRKPFFKKQYNDATAYFELTPDVKKDRALLSSYASYILQRILEK